MSESTSFHEVKKGNVVIKIYEGINRVGKYEYPQFTFFHTLDGKRKKQTFTNLVKAKREAKLVADKIAAGEHEVLKLTSHDRTQYLSAISALKPFGITLSYVAQDYAAAIKILPSGTSLREVAEFFAKRNPASMPKKSVREVADELVEAKRKAGRSDMHVKDLESRLGTFADAMNMNITEVTSTFIQKYLDDLQAKNLSGCTRRNHLRHITTLFNFAIKRKYLAKDSIDEVRAIEKPDEGTSKNDIFTPEELSLLFESVRSELVPYFAIAAFAGLRSAELQRLDWSEIDMNERHIIVNADKAKTASRRVIPISDNLALWLAPHAQSSGAVVPFANMAKQIVWLVDDVNAALKEGKQEQTFTWKHNALRHSFVSYRLAEIDNAAQVAMEAGNSPAMVFRHYRELVTKKQAKAWFSIVPKPTENVVTFPQDCAAEQKTEAVSAKV